MKTVCCSDKCERKFECARHSFNNEGLHFCENWYSFGTGTSTDEGCVVEHWCGEQGDWKMFEPLENNCDGCVYENVDDTTNVISNCVCCKRNVDFAKNDYYTKR
jgi:hypothetical protein